MRRPRSPGRWSADPPPPGSLRRGARPRSRRRAAAPPQRSEESAAGCTDLCVNKALLVLRDDPVPLPYSPMTIEDELPKIRWLRADQVSHHTIVAATAHLPRHVP